MLRLVVAPAVLGSGRRLLTHPAAAPGLRLVRHEATTRGLLLLEYEITAPRPSATTTASRISRNAAQVAEIQPAPRATKSSTPRARRYQTNT